MESRKIGGVRVDFGLGVPDVLAKIDEFVREPGSHFLFTVNPEFVMKARNDEVLRQVLNSSRLSVPDGVGILFAKKYLDRVSRMNRGSFFPISALVQGIRTGLTKVSETRLTGADMIFEICKNAEKSGQSVFLLGGWEKDQFGQMRGHHGNIADKAAQELKRRFPDLKIIGATSDFSDKESQDEKTIKQVHEIMTKAGVNSIDILFIGSTSGSQEKWIARNLPKIPAKVGIGVGASFDFISGMYKRAPDSMKRHNLEWLHRLINQPWRLKRIFISFPIFPLFIYLSSLKPTAE